MNLEKQSMIDHAIDALAGDFDSVAGCAADDYLWRVMCGDGSHEHQKLDSNAGYFGEFVCTRAEFEARKTERQNKPDWKDLPPETQWLGQDRCGKWKPMVGPQPNPERGYWLTHHHLMPQPRGEVIGDWRDTLEKRPSAAGETSLSDWYDYDKQEAIKLPPIGAEFELYPFFHPCEVVAHHHDGAVIYDKKALEYVHIKWGSFRCRPLDFNRKPETSPELSFHLSNAFNELQASARLLPDSDPRKTQLATLAGAVQAVREVV